MKRENNHGEGGHMCPLFLQIKYNRELTLRLLFVVLFAFSAVGVLGYGIFYLWQNESSRNTQKELKYISLCKIHKFIAEPVLYGVYVIDFSDRHVFINDFIYHIKVIKGVYTDRHKMGIEACAGIGVTHIVLRFHKIEILQGLYQLLVDYLSKADIMERKKKA